MSTSGSPFPSSTFEFGSKPSNESIHSFTFTSDRPRSTNMSGYLDDNPSASSSSNRQPDTLAPTSLFATLAQRQMDQQQLSQSQYDDDAEWTSRSRRQPRSKRHRRSSRYASESDSEEDDASDYTSDSSHDRALQQEWEDQLDQLKLMFQIIIFPFVGKFFGRKFGYFRKY